METATTLSAYDCAVVEDPLAVPAEIAANDAEAIRTTETRLRDDSRRETKEEREGGTF